MSYQKSDDSTLLHAGKAISMIQPYTLTIATAAEQMRTGQLSPVELMHSHSAYPMPLQEANLRLIPFLQKKVTSI